MHLEGTGSVGLREWSDVGRQPSRKPTDNAFVESFNGRFRDECLNTHWFLSLADARSKIDAWRRGYTECRPHTFLGWMTPAEFASSAGITPGRGRPTAHQNAWPQHRGPPSKELYSFRIESEDVGEKR